MLRSADSLVRIHPNEELLRREYEARADRDDAALADLFAEDVVWHVPGGSAIAGSTEGSLRSWSTFGEDASSPAERRHAHSGVVTGPSILTSVISIPPELR